MGEMRWNESSLEQDGLDWAHIKEKKMGEKMESSKKET